MSVTRAKQTAVIDAPVDKVWDLLKNLDFKFQSSVESSTFEEKGSAQEVGSTFVVKYKDATQSYQVREYSLDKYSVTFQLVTSTVKNSNEAVHTIRLRPVTESKQTFLSWATDFSASEDVAQVVQDSKFKKLDAFKDLRKALK